ncbi:MAG: GDYXXLXY domain-containing protein [Myxococcota bacterium]|nr:GDYXXLXY domain-containing protein [Myxococcota bacterium]
MNSSNVVRGLVAVVVFQLLVLSGEYLTSVAPLWFGEPAILKIRPVDPRSLFRGNYVALNYDLEEVGNEESISELKPLKIQDILYVSLKKKDGYHQAGSLSKTEPNRGLFIRGRVQAVGPSSIRLKYGIEAYFAPKERAREIEKRIRKSRSANRVPTSSAATGSEAAESLLPYARIRLLSSGKAALEELQWGLEDL